MVAINKRHWPAFIFTTVALIVIIWVIVIQMLWAGPVMSSGVSDSGRYAITAHKDNSLILWDLQNKKWQIMHTNANVYSAQFIPDAHAFLWQDLNDKVTAETIEGRNLLTFQHFPTYGHAISSDLKTYLSADKDWNIFAGFGESREPFYKTASAPVLRVRGNFSISLWRDSKTSFLPPVLVTIRHQSPNTLPSIKNGDFHGIQALHFGTPKPENRLPSFRAILPKLTPP